MLTTSISVPVRPFLLLLASLLLFAGSVTGQAPTWQWGLQSTNPTPRDGSDAFGYAVATSAAGQVYVGGSLNENGKPGAITRTFGNAGSVGPSRRGFVAQATAAGQWSWTVTVQPVGTSSVPPYTSVTGIAVAPTGEVYATGIVVGAAVQVGAQTQPLSSGNSQAVFVARLNSAGVCQALQVVEGSFNAPTLAFDPSTGGVVLAGTYHGPATFGPTVLPAGAASGQESVFVARLSAAGTWLGAAAPTGTAGIITGASLAVGPTGQVAVATSQSSGSLTFGPATLTVPTGIDQAYVVAQLSPANQWQWAVGSGGSSNSSWAIGAAYTSTGALWVSGRGNNGTTLGPLTLVAPTAGSSDSYAGFVGQLSATGQWGVVRQFSPSSSGLAVGGPLTVDAQGNAVVLGGLVSFGGTVQAQLGSQLLTTTSPDLLLFIATLNGAGQWRYLAAVPQPTLASGLNPTAVALDAGGSLYLTGGFRGSLALGSSGLTGSYDPTTPYPGFGDVVLGKLANATALAARPATAAPLLACYPNPAHFAATLHLPAAAEATAVVLLDALGRPARTYPLPARATTAVLDLAGLAPGLYVVRCGAASGQLVVE